MWALAAGYALVGIGVGKFIVKRSLWIGTNFAQANHFPPDNPARCISVSDDVKFRVSWRSKYASMME